MWLTLFRMSLFGAAHTWRGEAKRHTYPTMIKLGIVMLYQNMTQKLYKSRDTPLDFCWHQYFFIGNLLFLLYQEIQIQIVFNTYSNSLNFAWVFKGCFNKYGWTFAAKLATLSLPTIMVFWNKVYDVIISVHGVTPKYHHHVTQIIL